MQRFGLIVTQEWYSQLPSWQKELVRTSLELYAREERLKSAFQDYSFIVFPMSKAYEGYLKDYFYHTGMISESMYKDKHFRIGRAINPDINPTHRDEMWIYGEIEARCGREMAQLLWQTWLQCRNQIFHYFPDREKKLTLLEAGKCIEMIAQTMDQTRRCQYNIKTH